MVGRQIFTGETTSWGRKFLKKNIKEGVLLIKKRTIENKEQIKILDDKIKEENQ